MKMSKEELLKVLEAVRPGLAKKDIIQQAVHFVFTGSYVCTFNDQICIMHPFKTKSPFSVRGEEFYKIVKGISEETFDVEEDGGTVSISSPSTNAGLQCVLQDEDKIEGRLDELTETMAELKWEKLPKEFLKGVSLCSFSASTNMTHEALTGIYMKEKDMWSTDRLRASHFTMDRKMPELLLFHPDLESLLEFPVTTYAVSDTWAHFRTDEDVIFNCRRLKSEYLKSVSKIFTVKGTTYDLPEDLKSAIDSISFLSEGASEVSRYVEVSLSKDRLVAEAKKDIGWASKTIKLKTPYKGEAIKFRVNPKFFTQILELTTSITVQKSPAVAKFTTKDFEHVISLPIKE